MHYPGYATRPFQRESLPLHESMRWDEGGWGKRSVVEGDESLDLSSATPLEIPDPEGNLPSLGEFTDVKEDRTDRIRNIAVNFSSSLPLKLLRLLLGPLMIFSLIVLMVFSEQVDTIKMGAFMFFFPLFCLLPSWFSSEMQQITSENDFGPNKGTDRMSLNSFPGAERIRKMIEDTRDFERLRILTISPVGILVMLQDYFEEGSIGNVLILMTCLILLSIGVALTISLERSIQMRSTEFKYLPFHVPTQHGSQMHTVLSDLIEAHMDPDSASQWSAWLDELKPSIRNKLPPALARERIVQAIYLSNMAGEDGTNAWKLNNILTSIVRREMRDLIMEQQVSMGEFDDDETKTSENTSLPFNTTTLARLLEHTEAWQPGLFRIIRRVRNDILAGNVSLTDSEWRMDHDLPLTCADGQGDLFLMVHNFGEKEQTVEVEVVVPEGLPITQTFRVTPQPTPQLPAAIPLNSMSMTETLADRLSILMERGLVLWIGLAWSSKTRGNHPVQIHLRKEGGETIESVILTTDVQQRSGGSGSTQVRMRRASSLGIEALRDVRGTLKMR